MVVPSAKPRALCHSKCHGKGLRDNEVQKNVERMEKRF